MAAPLAYSLTMALALHPPRHGEYGSPLLAGLGLAFSAVAMWLGRGEARQLLQARLRPTAGWGRSRVLWAALAVFLACAATAWFVLDAFPISDDELAYIFQAQTYAEGRLWVPAPPVSAAVQLPHLFDLQGRWVSQYLPGWPLVMTPAVVIGAPLWLVDPLLAAATLAAFFALARRYVGRETAWLGVALLVANAFFLMTYGSYFNHGFTLLAGISFALFGSRYWESGRARDALLAGVCMGAMGLTRPQNAALFAAPFVAYLALSNARRRGLFWFGLGGAPFLAALLAYNAAFTGDPLKPVQAVMVHEPLGVGRWVWFKRALQRILRLPEWTSPILLLG
ncbi:MAG TPA: glycosyltransferase family 39 protein, partial [Phenylobacterium sp.]